MNQPVAAFRLPTAPQDIPGCLAFWDFQEAGPTWTSRGAAVYALEIGGGSPAVEDSAGAPFGPKALRLPEGAWLRIPRAQCPLLDRHGDMGLTVLAWIRRQQTARPQCEFLAGQWNETAGGRQYGLFLNIGVWGGRDQVCGHVSTCGGPTPGFKYCMDGAIGATPVPRDAWSCVGMAFDGRTATAWLGGRLDLRPEVNPYLLGSGLNDGGVNGSDFTVGGVHRHGEMGNFFTGHLGGLAVYDRALTPAEHWGLGA